MFLKPESDAAHEKKSLFALVCCVYLQNCVEGRCNIRDVQEVTCVGSISVKSELLARHQLVSELGDQFFGELVGPVHIVTTGDQTGELETAEVRLHQEFGTGLGCCVGIGRFQNVLFGHGIGFEILAFSIDLIGGNVNESLERLAVFGALEEDVGSVDIGVSERQRVTERVVDVGLGGKMHDGVNFFFQKRIVHNIGYRDITLDKLEVGQVLELVKILETTAVVQTVENDDVVLRVFLAQQNRNMGGNKTFTRMVDMATELYAEGKRQMQNNKVVH